jgi:hypothetical protein
VHGDHDAFLRIQIENRGSTALAPSTSPSDGAHGHAVALGYLRRLPFIAAEVYVRRYGRALMTVHPSETTELLAMLCTRYIIDTSPFTVTLGGQSILLHTVIKAPNGKTSDPKTSTTSTGRERARSDQPESFLPLFVDHPLYLKRFLTVLQQRASTGEVAKLSKPLWHALLEVSLRKDVHRAELQASRPEIFTDEGLLASTIESARDEDVLQSVLKNLSANYDADHALVLCQMHEYKPGCLFLYEKMRMYALVLSHYMEAADAARAGGRMSEWRASRREMLRKAKAWGDVDTSPDPSLWATVLQYLTRSYQLPGEGSGSNDDTELLFADALKHVDKLGILPPLRVIQILAENKNIPFGLVRDFIVKRLGADEDRIAEDSRAIDSFRTETATMLTEAHRLDAAPVVFQQRKCAQCGTDLDLPSVHFMCGGLRGEEHSFHQHCVYESDEGPACPICVADHKHVKEVRADIVAASGTREQTEQFYRELAAAPDGFTKCAEFLSKGVFDVATRKRGDKAGREGKTERLNLY